MLWRTGRLSCLRIGTQFSPLAERSTLRRTPVSRFGRSATRYSSTATSSHVSNTSPADPNDQVQRGDKETAALQQYPSSINKHGGLITQSPVEGSSVRLSGLIRSIRKQKRHAFAHISDGTTYEPFQAVLSPEHAQPLHNGAYVEFEGTWEASQGGKQARELHVNNVLRVEDGDVAASPIQKKEMTVDHLRTHPHMRLRIPTYSLLARVRSQVIGRAHDFYSGAANPADEAVYVQPPIITSSDCEGAGEVFTVTPKQNKSLQPSSNVDTKPLTESKPHVAEPANQHYFRSQKYLTVSSQLHLEAYSAELGDVWTLTPAFRAEESDTGRHLAELWMLEAEHRGVTELTELMSRVQNLIQYITRQVSERSVGSQLQQCTGDPHHLSDDTTKIDLPSRWAAILETPWKTFTYTAAMDAVEQAAKSTPGLFNVEPSWDSGLSLEHEKWIVENLSNNAPCFITHYPKAQKPFYMLPETATSDANQGRETVACFDLLLPHGTCEVVGGSLREHRLDHLVVAMRDKGLIASSLKSDEQKSPSNSPQITKPSSHNTGPNKSTSLLQLHPGESLGSLDWYVDLRRFGSSPHGGFGLGLDRLLMHLTGIGNVRDIVAFPRTFKNCIA